MKKDYETKISATKNMLKDGLILFKEKKQTKAKKKFNKALNNLRNLTKRGIELNTSENIKL